jgi:hypothetical protein
MIGPRCSRGAALKPGRLPNDGNPLDEVVFADLDLSRAPLGQGARPCRTHPTGHSTAQRRPIGSSLALASST